VQGLARRIVPRLSVLSGLASLALVLHGLTLLQPAPWTAPSIAATDEGFLVAWLDGDLERVPLRVQQLEPDLAPSGASHVVAQAWSSARVLLDHDPARGTRVRLVGDPGQPPWRVVATIDEQGRPGRRPPAVRDWPAELRPAPPPDVPSGQRCRVSSGSPVRDAAGRTRARVSFAPGGWARLTGTPGGASLTVERVGPATCAALSSGPCLAAAADDRGVVIVWTRSRALGSELVVSRLPFAGSGGRPSERVLRRAPSFALALAFAAFVGLVAGLAGHAASRGLEAGRILGAVMRRRAGTWLDGRLDDPTKLVAGADGGEYRMRTSAAWLDVGEGERVSLRPGRPIVVTAAAMRGELPALAAVVATFEHVWLAGRPALDVDLGPYRGGGARALDVEILSDRPLPVVRRAMLGSLAWSVLDSCALVAIVAGSFAAILW
jgi:hypothetical protein